MSEVQILSPRHTALRATRSLVIVVKQTVCEWRKTSSVPSWLLDREAHNWAERISASLFLPILT